MEDSTRPLNLEADLLVIGWGKAGKTLARDLASHGRHVVLVERDDAMIGGTCINVACVPTKTLVNLAERRGDRNPDEYLKQAIASRDSLIDRLRAANKAMLSGQETVTLVHGEARFTGHRRIRVRAGEETLDITAGAVVVNTGTSPLMPDVPGIQGRFVYDSTTIQHIADGRVPQTLTIVGGGFIGLEFASMFAAFGSAVRILERGPVFLPRLDDDVREAVVTTLTDRGIEIVTNAPVSAIENDGRRVVSGAGSFDTDAVLVAVGRKPETAALDLPAAGIATDERGFIVVDDHLRTSAEGVWAVGDVNGGPQFTYVSLDDYRIVKDQLVGDSKRSRADRKAIPTTTFITPPLAQVGLSEREATEQGVSYLVASKPVANIAAMPRPKTLGETHGLIKVLVDPATDEVLGATIFSVDAQEVINLVALAMRNKTTATALRDGIWTHPSTTEALNEVLGELHTP